VRARRKVETRLSSEAGFIRSGALMCWSWIEKRSSPGEDRSSARQRLWRGRWGSEAGRFLNGRPKAPSLALTPTAFSRHVSKLGLLKYALSLFGPLDAHDENAVREWMHKRRLRRDSGRQLWDHQIGNRLGSRCVRWVSLQSVMPHRDYGFDGPASTCRGSSPPPQLVSRPFRRDDYGAG